MTWANARAKQNAARHEPHLVGARLLTGLKGGPSRYKGSVWIPDQDIHATAKVQVGPHGLLVKRLRLLGLLCK